MHIRSTPISPSPFSFKQARMPAFLAVTTALSLLATFWCAAVVREFLDPSASAIFFPFFPFLFGAAYGACASTGGVVAMVGWMKQRTTRSIVVAALAFQAPLVVASVAVGIGAFVAWIG